MTTCRDLNHLVTPYIDGEMSVEERVAVEAHLAACPMCRQRAAIEAAARQTVRAFAARVCHATPEVLQHRCRQAATLGSPTASTRLRAFPVSMAAALVLVLGGVLVYALTASSATVLAAQLALDHMKCFALFGGQKPVEPAVAEEKLARDYGWAIQVPQGPAPDGLEGLKLVGARRCLYGEGALAHVMYLMQGRPLSLFMLPDTMRPGGMAGALGHDAVIWSGGGRTFVLMGREPRVELEKIAAYFEGLEQ
jgi:anti-sigma factor RsiW